jgi:hypothetical protein
VPSVRTAHAKYWLALTEVKVPVGVGWLNSLPQLARVPSVRTAYAAFKLLRQAGPERRLGICISLSRATRELAIAGFTLRILALRHHCRACQHLCRLRAFGRDETAACSHCTPST